MRTSKLNIAGKEYLLCMSNRVLVDIESKGQNLETFLQTEQPITNICWLIRRMSEAGRAYAKLAGLGDYSTISEESILDASGSDDYDEYMKAILEAATGERKVEAEPPKNVEGTHEEGQSV